MTETLHIGEGPADNTGYLKIGEWVYRRHAKESADRTENVQTGPRLCRENM